MASYDVASTIHGALPKWRSRRCTVGRPSSFFFSAAALDAASASLGLASGAAPVVPLLLWTSAASMIGRESGPDYRYWETLHKIMLW